VACIARHTGIKPANIQRVKQHLFYAAHLLDRYVDVGVPAEMRRFDSDLASRMLETVGTGPCDRGGLSVLRHEAASASHADVARPITVSHTRVQQRFQRRTWRNKCK
jgi:hypothetical protein